jgi:hypothetical protein
MFRFTLILILLPIFSIAPIHEVDFLNVINIYTVSATVYNAEESQCNYDYLTTACNSKIDLSIVNELRWVALSRDLISRWGGEFNYHDTIHVISNDERISGKWVVKDCMNSRFTNKLDFLQCKFTGICDKWDSIKILKL